MKKLFVPALMMNLIYFDQSGAARTSGGSIAVNVAGSDSTDACEGRTAYRPPSQITLRADNSAGAAGVLFKQPSFDSLVELINGSIGAQFMSVLEFPVTGVVRQNGMVIFSGEGLMALTATYCLNILKMQMSNTATTGLAQYTVNGFYGNPDGVDNHDIKMNLDNNISASVNTLSAIVNLKYTGNFAMRCRMPAATIADFTMFLNGYQPYTDLIPK